MAGATESTVAALASESATVAEIAQEWGRSADALYRDVRDGVIPAGIAIRVGRSVRINRRRFAEWLNAGGSLNTAA